MTQTEFKNLHKLDEQEMARIARLRAYFACTTPSVVIDQKEGRWVYQVLEKRVRKWLGIDVLTAVTIFIGLNAGFISFALYYAQIGILTVAKDTKDTLCLKDGVKYERYF